MDSETRSTVKVRLLMTVLQDQVSDGQVNPGQLQQAICSLTLRSFPLVPHWLSTMGCAVFLKVAYYFLAEYPSFSLPNLHPHFSKKTFLLMYPFSQHLVCLRNLQVHELCQVCKSLASLEPGNRQRVESYLFRIQSNLPP